MKILKPKFLSIIALFSIFTIATAQVVDEKVTTTISTVPEDAKTPTGTKKPCYWTYSGLYSLQTTQTGYYRWADGGENSLNFSAFANFASTYSKDRWLFDNYITLSYGTSFFADNDLHITDLKKTDDKIDISLTGGYKINKSKNDWYYSAMFTFLSQFDDGFDYSEDPILNDDGTIAYNGHRKIYPLKSSFLSPATMNLALGATYKYKDKLTILLSPFSGKLVVVADNRLTYDRIVKDEEGNEKHETLSTAGVEPGKHTKWGAGLLAEIRWKQPLNKANTIDIDSKLRVSNNYLDTNKSNRWNFDVYGQINLNFTVSKLITASIRLECIYDDEIHNYKYTKDGVTHECPSIQFKEIIGIGLAYKLEQKTK